MQCIFLSHGAYKFNIKHKNATTTISHLQNNFADLKSLTLLSDPDKICEIMSFFK